MDYARAKTLVSEARGLLFKADLKLGDASKEIEDSPVSDRIVSVFNALEDLEGELTKIMKRIDEE